MVQEIKDNGNGDELNEEPTLGHEVDVLLEQGYSQKEIKEQGYSASLIRQRVRKRTKRLGLPAPDNGGGNGRPQVALIAKEKEQILPEFLAGQIEELYDGSPTERKAFLAGISVPLLGLRMFQEMIKPLGTLMQLWSAGQAEAVKAQQGGAEDVAKSTIVEAMPYFKDMITEVSRNQAVNPLQGMLVRSIEPMFQNVIGNLMGGMFGMKQAQGQQGQGQSLPPGWETTEKTGE